MSETLAHGLTVADISKLYRVSPDKVRGWIKRGELSAINTSDVRCGKPRYIVTPAALAAFERDRQASTPAAHNPSRRKKTNVIDFYPD